jgi:hypothetical protein
MTGSDGKRHFSEPGHTLIKRAMKHAVQAALMRRLGRIKQVSLFLFGEEQLYSRDPLNEMHESMAVRANPQRRLCDERCFLRRSLVKQRAAEWQHAGSSAVGEESEVADTGKASWQHMLYEAAQELFGGECQSALPTVVGVVLPAEADLSGRDREQAMVGYGDAMRVASQIMQHVFGSAEGRPGIDDPVLPIERAQEDGEALLVVSGTHSPKKRN